MGDLPDPLEAVKAIQANLGEKIYEKAQDPTKLFPATFTDTTVNYRLDIQIHTLDAHIAYLRKLVSDAHKTDIDKWANTQDMWTKFKRSVTGHREMRIVDEWTEEITNVENGFRSAGHTPVTETLTSEADGRYQWTQLDPGGTLLKNPKLDWNSYSALVESSKTAGSSSHMRLVVPTSKS